MLFLRLLLFLTIGGLVLASTELTPRERLQMHKAWLDQRSALKSMPNNNSTSEKSSYFRKIIKFKNEREPIFDNDITFMPKKEFDASLFNSKQTLVGQHVPTNEINKYNIVGKTDSNEYYNRLKVGTSTAKTLYFTTPLSETKSPTQLVEQTTEKSGKENDNFKSIADQVRKRKKNDRNSEPYSNQNEIITTLLQTDNHEHHLSYPHRHRGRHSTDVIKNKENAPNAIGHENINQVVSDFNKKEKVSGTDYHENSDEKFENNRNYLSTTTATPLMTIIVNGKKRNYTSLWNTNNRKPLTKPLNKTITSSKNPQYQQQQKADSSKKLKNDTNYHLTMEHHSAWGPWSKWSACSRSCGGGVRSQSRDCIRKVLPSHDKNKTNSVNSTDCIGIYKRYHICNEEMCPDGEIDFREQQCIYFNSHIFRGKQYSWEAFIKDDSECELNCKPISMNYFATLNETVVDGTPCSNPVENFRNDFVGRAVCVEGICKTIQNNGIITGAYMNNGAVRCGALICRPVTGIFTKNPLSNGYINVATIPTGASNISITELKNSMNFLVLKSIDQKYIINGNYSISTSGIYEAAGTVFDYRRIDGITNGSSQGFRKIEGVTEWITSLGPTSEPIHLMVLVQQSNPGIKYEYQLPISSYSPLSNSEEDVTEGTSAETEQPISMTTPLSEKFTASLKSASPVLINSTVKPPLRKRKFLWKIIGFNQCSKSCGGGIQTPIIKCVREAPTRFFAPKKCAHLQQLSLNENQLRCNIHPCPAYWKISDWNECPCNSFNENNMIYQTREVKCVQELTTGMVIQVNSGACMESAPIVKQKCECSKLTRVPQLEVYKHNRFSGNLHQQTINDETNIMKPNRLTQSIISLGNNSTGTGRRVHQVKKNGIWLTSDWNEQCTTDCGIGIQYRTIFCERSLPNTERCDLRFTPETTRQCTSDKKCNFGDWFVGPWSKCIGDCFNLTKTRSVFCIKEDVISSEKECEPTVKPSMLLPCELNETRECAPRWHYSEWTECSEPCNGGTQKRVVKCFESNLKEKQLKESQSCRYSERPTGYRTCNTQKCEDETTSAPKVDFVQNDITPECKDHFLNCHLVIEARLCSYAYYSQHCCLSCKNKSEDLH